MRAQLQADKDTGFFIYFLSHSADNVTGLDFHPKLDTPSTKAKLLGLVSCHILVRPLFSKKGYQIGVG